MTVTHLLDTDVAIEVLRRRDPALPVRLATLPGDVAISAITSMELTYGVERSRHVDANQEALDDFVALVPALPFDQAAASHAGRIRAELRRRGEPIGPYDTLIAGHARAQALTLATGNLREFSRVTGLLVEDWSPPASQS